MFVNVQNAYSKKIFNMVQFKFQNGVHYKYLNKNGGEKAKNKKNYYEQFVIRFYSNHSTPKMKIGKK